MNTNHKKRIGIALGSGAARGCAHIGILKALDEIGIIPEIVCGSSVGAVVGASYASGNLEKLEKGFRSLTKMQIIKFLQFDFSLNNFIEREKIKSFFAEFICNENDKMSDLSKKLGVVATILEKGIEMPIIDGLVFDAISSSIALPGLFSPFNYNGKWLIDGGITNPVPVSLCRELGADIVIAVDLNSDIVGKHLNKKKPIVTKNDNDIEKNIFTKVEQFSDKLFFSKKEDSPPNIINTILDTINIMQYRITQERLKKDNPDILLIPKLSHIGLIEFDRAGESIQEGASCVINMRSKINQLM